ncbi:hypothetical protein Bhyg_08891 [Pseudolycoriella hygida]|uniref:Uncharacterized protein n=1 Tax=Pseudolycoriella hygida TaxID=35572 RepID=A0A9Q0N6R8_9DIPT|nr:hypothetical protein Bhyg_08891 [Pseudolycoriella hygida]
MDDKMSCSKRTGPLYDKEFHLRKIGSLKNTLPKIGVNQYIPEIPKEVISTSRDVRDLLVNVSGIVGAIKGIFSL